MNKVIVGIGVPGCGKTTYLKPLADKLGLTYINPDDIRQEITGDAGDHSKETIVWKTVHGRIKNALKLKDVVVDATYTKTRDRKELTKLCKENGAKEIIAYWFNLPLQTCLERNRDRERAVPEAVIEKMHNRLLINPPALEEGFTKIIAVENRVWKIS